VNPEKTKYSKTWLIQNTRNQKKKFFWIMKNLYN
jgi:hypothetical protein